MARIVAPTSVARSEWALADVVEHLAVLATSAASPYEPPRFAHRRDPANSPPPMELDRRSRPNRRAAAGANRRGADASGPTADQTFDEDARRRCRERTRRQAVRNVLGSGTNGGSKGCWFSGRRTE